MCNKLEILISSCDKYSYLWDALEFSHKNYLGEETKNITYLVSETKKSNYFHTKNYQGRWREMILSFLKESTSQYILYTQDDYMFWKKKVPFEYFLDLTEYCTNKDIDHMLITNKADVYRPSFVENCKWGEYHKREYSGNYLASLQMGLWKREYFIKLLESFEPQSIWEFELSADNVVRKIAPKTALFYTFYEGEHRIFEPSEIVRKGELIQESLSLVKESWEIHNPDKQDEIIDIFKKLIEKQ